MEPEELAAILDRYGALLRAVAAERCRWPDDCVQEALIRLSGLDQRPNQPLAWLITTVRHLALDQSRSEARRSVREQQVGLNHARGTRDPEEVAALHQLLEQLDEDSRQLVLMRVWGGMGFAELAELSGGSVATVHRRYVRILEQLRDWWEGTCQRTKSEPTASSQRPPRNPPGMPLS